MPSKKVTPEEWERLTGGRGSVHISFPPAKKKSRDLYGSLPEETVYLCPHCLELLSGPTLGVRRCDLCGKSWPVR